MKGLFCFKLKRRSRLVFICIGVITAILLVACLIALSADIFVKYSPKYYEPKDLERQEWLSQKEDVENM